MICFCYQRPLHQEKRSGILGHRPRLWNIFPSIPFCSGRRMRLPSPSSVQGVTWCPHWSAGSSSELGQSSLFFSLPPEYKGGGASLRSPGGGPANCCHLAIKLLYVLKLRPNHDCLVKHASISGAQGGAQTPLGEMPPKSMKGGFDFLGDFFFVAEPPF